MLTDRPIADFDALTAKQQETATLLAEGLTGKEMAVRLDVSHSAVAQRIETLRSKFGGVTKHELARLAREWLAESNSCCDASHSHVRSAAPQIDDACIKYTGQKNHLPRSEPSGHQASRNRSETDLHFADAFTINATAPWMGEQDDRLVPEVLDGENAEPARWAYVVVAAVGMAILLLVLLAVVNAVSELV